MGFRKLSRPSQDTVSGGHGFLGFVLTIAPRPAPDPQAEVLSGLFLWSFPAVSRASLPQLPHTYRSPISYNKSLYSCNTGSGCFLD